MRDSFIKAINRRLDAFNFKSKQFHNNVNVLTMDEIYDQGVQLAIEAQYLEKFIESVKDFLDTYPNET